MFLQCDVFSLNESTETLEWTSRAPCDAIVLAGVLRCNTVLTTLNVARGRPRRLRARGDRHAPCSQHAGPRGLLRHLRAQGACRPSHSVDLKDKEQIRSLRSFTLFAGLLRANSTLTSLTLASVTPSTSTCSPRRWRPTRRCKSCGSSSPTRAATRPSRRCPCRSSTATRDGAHRPLGRAGEGGPLHRHACGVVGALLARQQVDQAAQHQPGRRRRGRRHPRAPAPRAQVDAAHARRDRIGLGDRGGSRFFETLIAGTCSLLTSLQLGDNKLTDLPSAR